MCIFIFIFLFVLIYDEGKPINQCVFYFVEIFQTRNSFLQINRLFHFIIVSDVSTDAGLLWSLLNGFIFLNEPLHRHAAHICSQHVGNHNKCNGGAKPQSHRHHGGFVLVLIIT